MTGEVNMRSEKRQRTKLVAVRMTPDERDSIVAGAKSAGVTVGRFIREAALGEAREPGWVT